MTTLQINAAIAQVCGWKHKTGFRWQNSEELAFYEWDIPNYCNDLNEMHEAEKTIYNHNNLWTAYYYQIGAGPFSLHVTARKKAEAFLRIHGKWEEEQK